MITKNKAYLAVCSVISALLIVAVLVPFWLLIAGSVTEETELVKSGYHLFPKTLTLESYRMIFSSDRSILRALLMSVIISSVGVTVNLSLTALFAYPLSRKDLPGRYFFSMFIFLTTIFNGGLVPTYMVYTQIFHIKDTVFAMIVPGLLLNAFNIILMRTYINTNIPNEIQESAKIDGARELNIFFRIILPLAKPIIGALGLMVFIGYWNNWTNGIYYVNARTELWGIQNYLKRLMDSAELLRSQVSAGMGISLKDVPSIGLKMAIAVIGVVPVLVLYPFFQKTFVKGITIGSVKG